MRLGVHLSIAGGAHNALLEAQRLELEAVAMFVRNQRQWRAPALRDEEVELFRETRKLTGIAPVVAHGSYLVNLAGEGDFYNKSLVATADELDRCCRLGIEYLVIHPGSCVDVQAGLRRIAESLTAIMGAAPKRGPKILLESTAGQGNCLGCSFDQLAEILSQVRPAGRFGVCLDTCHIFADGYDIRTREGYEATMEAFDKAVGLKHLMAIHLNDSLKDLGSHVDRHAHIGKGKIGLEAFAHLVNDPRLTDMPMILETPHGTTPDGENLDEINIATIRRLVL